MWASCIFDARIGEKYAISFTVDSKSGTHGGAGNCSMGAGTWSGTTSINNAALGRNALIVTATSNATARWCGLGWEWPQTTARPAPCDFQM